MDNAVTALAAGAIGSLITIGATVGVRFFAAHSEVKTHDRLVADLNSDLEQWVVDDYYRLKRELRSLRNELNDRNLFYSSEYNNRIGFAKERALQAYRDQETRAEREAALIEDREGGMHEFWRRRDQAPWRGLAAPAKVKPVLDVWRVAPVQDPSKSDEPSTIDDPTARTLDELLKEAPVDLEAFR